MKLLYSKIEGSFSQELAHDQTYLKHNQIYLGIMYTLVYNCTICLPFKFSNEKNYQCLESRYERKLFLALDRHLKPHIKSCGPFGLQKLNPTLRILTLSWFSALIWVDTLMSDHSDFSTMIMICSTLKENQWW